MTDFAAMLRGCNYTRGLHDGCGECVKVATDADGGKWCCGDKAPAVKEPVWLDRGGTSARWREVSKLHPSTDGIVVKRARRNADAPYDPQTCTNYPWAAAARIKVLEDELREMRQAAKATDTVSGAEIPQSSLLDAVSLFGDVLRERAIGISGACVVLPWDDWQKLRHEVVDVLGKWPDTRLGEFMYNGLRFVVNERSSAPEPDPVGQWIAEIESARALIGPHNPAREALMWAELGLERSADGDVAEAPIPADRVEYCKAWTPKNCARYPHGASSYISALEEQVSKLDSIRAVLDPAGILDAPKQGQNQDHDKDQADNA